MEEKLDLSEQKPEQKKTKKKSNNLPIVIAACAAVAAIIVIIFVLTGNKGGIVGKWCYEKGTAWCYIFNSDGTGSYGTSNSSDSFKYTISNGKLHIEYDNGNPNDLNLVIADDHSKMTISNDKAEAVYLWTEEKEEATVETTDNTDEQESTEEEKEHEEEIKKEYEEQEKEEEK